MASGRTNTVIMITSRRHPYVESLPTLWLTNHQISYQSYICTYSCVARLSPDVCLRETINCSYLTDQARNKPQPGNSEVTVHKLSQDMGHSHYFCSYVQLKLCLWHNRNECILVEVSNSIRGLHTLTTKIKCVVLAKYLVTTLAWLSLLCRMQWELIYLNKLYSPPSECFTSPKFF